MGSRVERTLQDPEHEPGQPRQDDTPEGLGMSDFENTPGQDNPGDPLDRLFENPEFRAKVRELVGK